MKKRNYIFAIASLILVSMMIWFSCEKENSLTPYNQVNLSESLVLPAEVAMYLTESEINTYYNDIIAVEKDVPPRYELRTVAMTMNLEYKYSNHKALPYPTKLFFAGTGIWKDFGAVRYKETINLFEKAPAPTGEGVIYVSRYESGKSVLPADQLNFVSSMRKDVVYEGGNIVKKASPTVIEIGDKTIKSRLDFERGTGVFDAAYGVATKKEVYYPDKPNYCKSVIYGYVLVKNDDFS